MSSHQKSSEKTKETIAKITAPELPPSSPQPAPTPPAPSPSSPEAPTSNPDPTAPPPRRKNPRLDHWSVFLAEADPIVEGEFLYRLRGEIHGHPNPRFSDGQIVDSSPLVFLDVTQRVAKTKNTVYELGEPDPTFIDFVERIGKKIEDYNFVREENLRKHPRRL